MARAGAVVLASALAVTLGAGPVSAETSTANGAVGTTSSAASFSASDVHAAGVPTSAVRFGSGVITTASTNRFFGNASFSAEDGAVATVFVNGVAKGTVTVLYSVTAGDTAIAVDIPRVWGSGKVQLNISGVVSNVFYARKQVTTLRKDKYALSVKRRNSKITFKARQIKVVNPSTGSYSRIKSVKLQQLKSGKWKTKKTIKLNSKGNGSYSTHLSKKYRYRLYTARTATQEQFFTRKTGKI